MLRHSGSHVPEHSHPVTRPTPTYAGVAPSPEIHLTRLAAATELAVSANRNLEGFEMLHGRCRQHDFKQVALAVELPWAAEIGTQSDKEVTNSESANHVMKLRLLWERWHAHRRAVPAPFPRPSRAMTRKCFEPLTHDQSIAVLDDAIQWLINEAKATRAMPDGPERQRRRAELRGRDKSMARDFARLMRQQRG